MPSRTDQNGLPPLTLGLHGWAATFANLSAVALVCWLLYYGLTATVPQLQEGFRVEMREERSMFREELKALRVEIASDRQALIANQRAILESLAEIRRQRDREAKP